MKTKTVVSDINHEDLVELLSTASYGRSWLKLNYDSMEYLALNNNAPDKQCLEDKCALLLLNGKTIDICDYYAEDSGDSYDSKLPHNYDEDCGSMDYTVSLKDIENGLSKMLDAGGLPAKYVMNLINADDGDFDQPQAESIIQHILWGCEIYG